MKGTVFLAGLGIVGFFLMGWRAPLCPQEVPAEKHAKAKGIEGIWTQIHSETDGDSTPSMMNPAPSRPSQLRGTRGMGFDEPQPIWKFSKEEVEIDVFPLFRSHYQLNPGGEMGAIDMIPLDKNGKKIETEKWKGIYFLKDDILMICSTYAQGAPRPREFTTSARSESRLVILRRGKLK